RRTARTVDLVATPQRRRPRGRERWYVGLSVGLATVLVATPLLALIERSLWSRDGYTLRAWRNLGNDEIRPGLTLGIDPLGALWRSVTTAMWATIFSVLLGAIAIVAISALGRAGKLLDAGLMLPLGTSAVTIGFGMLITFDTDPFDWRASWWLVPIGHALVALPFVVRSGLGVVRAIDPDLRAAASTLGAPPIRAWATTTLPMMRRPLAIAAGLAAAISLGEFGATSFLSRTGSDTLPIAIERLLGRTGGSFQAQAGVIVLDVADVSVVFDDVAVLDDVSLRVADGEIVALLGPSGSGKSTLLRVVAGLVPPYTGTVRIGDADVTHVPTHRRAVGMVFQDEQLFPHLSVGDNVGYGLKMQRMPGDERTRRVSELLEVVGLPGFEGRDVGDLSGGEAKRVAVARSLAPHPKVLLLDEPLTGLDRELHDRLMVEIAAILRRVGTTAVWVTHDADEAATVADRTVHLGDL
ncbi:fbpC, partial [Symbiodinium sp. KB8]